MTVDSVGSGGSSRLVVYAVLVAVGVLGAASDAVLNQWARTGSIWWQLAAYASWILVATLLGWILRMNYFTFGAAVVLFLMVNSVAALLIDSTFFAGRLSLRGWIGIALAAAAIVTIELDRSHAAPFTPPSKSHSDR